MNHSTIQKLLCLLFMISPFLVHAQERRISGRVTDAETGDNIPGVNIIIKGTTVGTSTDSWERAAAAAVERASQSLRDLRIAEVVQLDMQLEEGKIVAYRAKVKVSFKYESNE